MPATDGVMVTVTMDLSLEELEDGVDAELPEATHLLATGLPMEQPEGKLTETSGLSWRDALYAFKRPGTKYRRFRLGFAIAVIVTVCILLSHGPSQGQFLLDYKPSPSAPQLSCVFAPGAYDDCRETIHSVMCRANGEHQKGAKIPRILFLGDSTLQRIIELTGLHDQYMEGKNVTIQSTGVFECKRWNHIDFGKDRCHINEQLGLAYVEEKNWKAPREGLEGPAMYGAENMYCQDKRGGLGDVMDCQPDPDADLEGWFSQLTKDEKDNLVYAGFLGVEFARDVEVQTPQFSTTQENIAHFVAQRWNTQEMLRIYEKPTCVINTGHHDVIITGMTQETYVANVKWYLHMMAEQCETILWPATTAPATNDRFQKIEGTRQWGLAVRNMMSEDPVLKEKTVYIDGYLASVSYEHNDNSKFGCSSLVTF